jgi:cell division protein FtsL
MSIDIEYAIKKDIRNNPVIRELDTREKREFRRIVWLACLVVAMVLFSAWQHFETLNHSMRIERLRTELAAEERINRKLRLNVETLSAPDRIERRARQELGLVPPSLRDTLVIERARTSTPAKGLVAQAR